MAAAPKIDDFSGGHSGPLLLVGVTEIGEEENWAMNSGRGRANRGGLR